MLPAFLAQAQSAEPPSAGGGIGSFVPFIVIFIIVYFVVIRPRRKRQEQQQKSNMSTSEGESRPTQVHHPHSRERAYICPRCGSSKIQSLPLLYEAGTSTSISKGRVIGVAGLGTDHLTPAGGLTTTTHRQQTLLAARYSPPSPPKASNDIPAFTALLFIGALILIISGIALLASRSDDFPLWSFRVLGSLLILAGIATFIPALKIMHAEQEKLMKTYRSKLLIWQQSFVCHKCGYVGTLRAPPEEQIEELSQKSG